jgi:transcriptional regulator with XRE-family HTH domain
MTIQPLPFGILLRRWRMTQADVAHAAGSSTRHMSFLENGRSHPSRELIARIAECLEVGLRDHNRLLLAAGFAPAFRERPLGELEAAKAAIDSVLRAHRPYPAFAVDRHWNVVLSNAALPQIYEGCSPDLLRAPINAMRLILHPAGMGPRIVNFAEWRAHALAVLRQQVETHADPVIQRLHAEISAYPVPRGSESRGGADASGRLATPLRIATRLGTVSFLNAVTVFGTPNDVTLSELALEMLFPADATTIEIVRSMVLEQAASPVRDLVA